MKSVNIMLEDNEFEELIKRKKDCTWRQYIMQITPKTDDLLTLTNMVEYLLRRRDKGEDIKPEAVNLIREYYIEEKDKWIEGGEING